MKIIKSLFDYWGKSKEQKITKLAVKLINLCNEIGREPASNNEAASITIYEYSHVSDLLEITDGYRGKINISFNHKGVIVK